MCVCVWKVARKGDGDPKIQKYKGQWIQVDHALGRKTVEM